VATPHPAEYARGMGVHQLRVVVEAEDYEKAVAFFRDVVGLPVEETYSSDGGAEVTIMGAGRATLEIANPAQKDLIDDVEVGRHVAPKIRLAFQVDDTPAMTDKLVDAGAELVAPPTVTPWHSLNSRLEVAAGLHVTLFAEGTDAY
jgi:predicted enzyme related to lactoylglutathione lyase